MGAPIKWKEKKKNKKNNAICNLNFSPDLNWTIPKPEKKKGQKITDFKLEKTESTIFGKQEAAYVEMAENYQIFTINIAELLSSLRKHSEALPLNFPCL